eukprot:363747-Chlamydomonas_euryale.AAC.2
MGRLVEGSAGRVWTSTGWGAKREADWLWLAASPIAICQLTCLLACVLVSLHGLVLVFCRNRPPLPAIPPPCTLASRLPTGTWAPSGSLPPSLCPASPASVRALSGPGSCCATFSCGCCCGDGVPPPLLRCPDPAVSRSSRCCSMPSCSFAMPGSASELARRSRLSSSFEWSRIHWKRAILFSMVGAYEARDSGVAGGVGCGGPGCTCVCGAEGLCGGSSSVGGVCQNAVRGVVQCCIDDRNMNGRADGAGRREGALLIDARCRRTRVWAMPTGRGRGISQVSCLGAFVRWRQFRWMALPWGRRASAAGAQADV